MTRIALRIWPKLTTEKIKRDGSAKGVVFQYYILGSIQPSREGLPIRIKPSQSPRFDNAKASFIKCQQAGTFFQLNQRDHANQRLPLAWPPIVISLCLEAKRLINETGQKMDSWVFRLFSKVAKHNPCSHIVSYVNLCIIS